MTSLTEFFNMVLPFAYVLVLIALIWFIIELVFTIRRTRTTVVDLKKKLDPTLDHVEKITASLEPIASKVDPLVDRVSLTVDAANLEIMRLDQILEDVNEITSTVSSAANAVDSITNAPLNLVSNVTSKIRTAFKPSHASDESVNLGERNVGEVAHDAVSGVKEAVHEQSVANQVRKEERQEHDQARQASQMQTDAAAAQMTNAVSATISADTEDINNRYFTYDAMNGSQPQQAQAQPQQVQVAMPEAAQGQPAQPSASQAAPQNQNNSPWPTEIPVEKIIADLNNNDRAQ